MVTGLATQARDYPCVGVGKVLATSESERVTVQFYQFDPAGHLFIPSSSVSKWNSYHCGKNGQSIYTGEGKTRIFDMVRTVTLP
jgi:hypothetical protein